MGSRCCCSIRSGLRSICMLNIMMWIWRGCQSVSSCRLHYVKPVRSNCSAVRNGTSPPSRCMTRCNGISAFVRFRVTCRMMSFSTAIFRSPSCTSIITTCFPWLTVPVVLRTMAAFTGRFWKIAKLFRRAQGLIYVSCGYATSMTVGPQNMMCRLRCKSAMMIGPTPLREIIRSVSWKHSTSIFAVLIRM